MSEKASDARLVGIHISLEEAILSHMRTLGIFERHKINMLNDVIVSVRAHFDNG